MPSAACDSKRSRSTRRRSLFDLLAPNLSKSRWVAEAIRKYASHEWPEECLTLAGRFADFPLREDVPAVADAPRLAALAQLLQPMQLLPFDSACAQHAAHIRATLEAAGTPIGPHDTLIAATALRHQATLVARNESEFLHVTGLHWVNWHAVG